MTLVLCADCLQGMIKIVCLMSTAQISTGGVGPVGKSNSASSTPFAKAIESFLLELKQTTKNTKSDFYKEVLVEAYNLNAVDGTLSASEQSAQRLQSVVHDLGRKRKQNSKASWLGDRLRPFVDGLQQFTSALDVMAQAAPSAAVVAYGGARLLLQLVDNLYGCQDAIEDMLEQMGLLLLCYPRFSSAYQENAEMQKLLVSSYKSIIRFWYNAAELCSRKTYKILLSATIRPLAKEWRKCRDALRSDREGVQALAQALEADLRKQKDLETDAQKKIDLKKHVMAWIKGAEEDLDCQTAIRQNLSKRHANTCSWLFCNSAFESWIGCNRSCTMLFSAGPGSGKTVLSSTVAKELQSRGLDTITFLCSFNHASRRKAMSVLRAVAIGLLRLNEEVPDSVKILYETDAANVFSKLDDADTDKAVQVLQGLAAQVERVHVVVDGLDECIEREQLLEALCQVTSAQTHGIVKWFLTTRPEPAFRSCFQRPGVIELAAPADCTSDDIRIFMTDGLQRGKFAKQIDHWVSRAETNFLLARLTLNTLNGMGLTCDEDIKEELYRFPKDLTGCYMRFLEYLRVRSDLERDMVRKIFVFLIASAQPLRLSELSHALAATRRTTTDFSEKSLPTPGIIEQLCSNLVTFDRVTDEKDPLVYFAHKSIQDFLVQDPGNLKAPEDVWLYFTTRNLANLELGKACVRYLSYKRYNRYADVPILLEDDKHAFLRYAATFWHRHLSAMVPSPKTVDQIRNFIKSPAFWNSITVQGHVAPHLLARFESHGARHFSYGVARAGSSARAFYASPLPQWMEHHFPDITEDVHNFTMQWHCVLSFRPEEQRQCLMDQKWESRWPEKSTWNSKQVMAWTIESHESAVSDVVTNSGLEDERFAMRCSNLLHHSFSSDSKRQATFQDLLRCFDVHEESETAAPMLPGISRIHPAVLKHTTEHTQLTQHKAADDHPNDGTCSHKWEVVGVYCDNRAIQHPQASAAVVFQWTLIHETNEEDEQSNFQSSDDESGYESSNGNDTDYADDSHDSSEDDSKDSDSSDEESATSVDDSTYADGASLSDSKRLDFEHCLVITREGQDPVPCFWKSQSMTMAHSSFHPTKPLVLWSSSDYELCTVDLASGYGTRVQKTVLPEPNDTTFDFSAADYVHKEFHFSEETHLVFYLLFAVKATEGTAKMILSISSFEWFEDNKTGLRLHRASPATTIEYLTAGAMQAPHILVTWQPDHVVIALPPLSFNPKIVRFPLSSSSNSSRLAFETLYEPTFFPNSTPDRSPQLHYFSRPGKSNLLALSLAAEACKHTSEKPDINEIDAKILQPPIVMTWEIDNNTAWRRWDATTDKETEEDRTQKERVQRLRGSYVDAEKRFQVPVRSGLDWRRQAVITCA